ncbi:hypothetical protein NE865_13131 [Phthorimaea operculella]|nr:hypothetical protein NE865_13131 [Phthorimaea operculella]
MPSSCVKPVFVNASPLHSESPNRRYKNREDPIGVKTSSSEDKLLFSRRRCGCVRTSDKLKNILKTFPQAPPPTGACKEQIFVNHMQADQRMGRFCAHTVCPAPTLPTVYIHDLTELQEQNYKVQERNRHDKSEVEEDIKPKDNANKYKTWIYELVSLLQLSVTATALIIYYIIYCYMQLVYYLLRSVVFFHHADLPMKITITIVTMTFVFLGAHTLFRMESLVGISSR